jgi:lysophospholipase L1-like esterase
MKRFIVTLVVTIFVTGCGSTPPATSVAPSTPTTPSAPVVASRSPTVVFLGDSITYNWGLSWASPDFSEHPTWNDQGVTGQNSYQLLFRFQADVVSQHPQIVHILTGTNDVYPGWVLCGGSPIFDTCNNIKSMVAMAQAAGITPILATIPPWGPGALPESADPSPEHYTHTDQLNQWIKVYGKEMGLVVIDYHRALETTDGQTYVPDLTVDGVHPSAAGYTLMTPMVEDAIAATQIHHPRKWEAGATFVCPLGQAGCGRSVFLER